MLDLQVLKEGVFGAIGLSALLKFTLEFPLDVTPASPVSLRLLPRRQLIYAFDVVFELFLEVLLLLKQVLVPLVENQI